MEMEGKLITRWLFEWNTNFSTKKGFTSQFIFLWALYTYFNNFPIFKPFLITRFVFPRKIVMTLRNLLKFTRLSAPNNSQTLTKCCICSKLNSYQLMHENWFLCCTTIQENNWISCKNIFHINFLNSFKT